MISFARPDGALPWYNQPGLIGNELSTAKPNGRALW